MKKKIVISETELITILNKIIVKEQGSLLRKAGQALGKVFRNSADDAVSAAAKKGTRTASNSMAKTVVNVAARNSREYLKKLINNVPQLEQRFSKETVDELADFLNMSLVEGKTIFRNENGVEFIYSASGDMIPLNQLQGYLYFVANEGSDLMRLSDRLPRVLNTNPPLAFRENILRILSKGKQNNRIPTAKSGVGKQILGLGNLVASNTISTGMPEQEAISLIQQYYKILSTGDKERAKQFYTQMTRKTNEVTKQGLSALRGKIQGLENRMFDSRSVRVLREGDVSGRKVIEVALPNNQNVVMYRSSGANVATTGKKAGEWFIIPAWGDGVILEDPRQGLVYIKQWFIKTQESINLAKGGNRYITDLARFLETNGPEMLGK